MHIAFDCYFDEAPLFLAVALRLQEEYGVRASGVSYGRRWGKLLSRAGLPTVNMGEYLEANWGRFRTDRAALSRLERRIGDPILTHAIYSDRFLSRRPWGDALRFLVGMAEFWERYYEEHAPDLYVNCGVAFTCHILAELVARQTGTHFRATYLTRQPSGRTVFSSHYIESWSRVNRIFREAADRPLAAEARAEAEEFIQAFRDRRPLPSYMQVSWIDRGFRREFAAELLRRFRRWYLEGWGRGPDFITPSPWSNLWRDATTIVRAQVRRRLPVFDPVPTPDDPPFILFCLHYQPEATTLIQAPHCVDQLALVESLARSTPSSHLLCVKEHRPSLGRRPVGYYRRLKALGNVRLISPFADNMDLVQRADAVITLTGTVGWEALLFERPVVVLGKPFYCASGLAYRQPDPNCVGETLSRALREHTADTERLVRYVAAIFQGSFPGEVYVPHANPAVMAPDNVARLAKGIYEAAADPELARDAAFDGVPEGELVPKPWNGYRSVPA